MIKEITIQITENSPFEKQKSKDLTFQDWSTIVGHFADVGIEKCTIVGGEPVLHKNFYDILEMCIDLFEKVIVETYGVTQTEFSKYNCEISTYFEDCSPERHDDKFGKVQIGEEVHSPFQIAVRKMSMISNEKIVRFSLNRSTDLLKSVIFAEKLFSGSRFYPSDTYILNHKKLISIFKEIRLLDSKFEHSHRIEHPLYYIWNVDLHREFLNKFLRGVFINSKGECFSHPLLIENFKLSEALDIPVIDDNLTMLEKEIKIKIGGIRW